jgi:hypothetical protein
MDRGNRERHPQRQPGIGPGSRGPDLLTRSRTVADCTVSFRRSRDLAAQVDLVIRAAESEKHRLVGLGGIERMPMPGDDQMAGSSRQTASTSRSGDLGAAIPGQAAQGAVPRRQCRGSHEKAEPFHRTSGTATHFRSSRQWRGALRSRPRLHSLEPILSVKRLSEIAVSTKARSAD